MASGEVNRSASGWLPILFLLVTLPLGAQLLARGAYLSGTTLKGLERDPLAEELPPPVSRAPGGEPGIELP